MLEMLHYDLHAKMRTIVTSRTTDKSMSPHEPESWWQVGNCR